jgi:hypothetical protein
MAVSDWEIGENNTGTAQIELDEGDYSMKFSVDPLERFYLVYFSAVPGQHNIKDGEVRMDMKQFGIFP